jgi:hypothetical protein
MYNRKSLVKIGGFFMSDWEEQEEWEDEDDDDEDWEESEDEF